MTPEAKPATAGRQAAEDEALDNAIAALGQGQKGTARQFLGSAIYAATAKLREELEQCRLELASLQDWVCSRISPAQRKQVDEWAKERLKDFPSATTPDVEQAIERLEHECLITAEPESGLAKDILTVCRAAQAREPLANLLRELREHSMGLFRQRIDAALTSTGEKPDTPETVAAKCKQARKIADMLCGTFAIKQEYFDKVYGKKKQPTKGK